MPKDEDGRKDPAWLNPAAWATAGMVVIALALVALIVTLVPDDAVDTLEPTQHTPTEPSTQASPPAPTTKSAPGESGDEASTAEQPHLPGPEPKPEPGPAPPAENEYAPVVVTDPTSPPEPRPEPTTTTNSRADVAPSAPQEVEPPGNETVGRPSDIVGTGVLDGGDSE